MSAILLKRIEDLEDALCQVQKCCGIAGTEYGCGSCQDIVKKE